jgi:hypothetical protein
MLSSVEPAPLGILQQVRGRGDSDGRPFHFGWVARSDPPHGLRTLKQYGIVGPER